MEALTPRYSKEEFARRGDEIYARNISPQIKKGDEGKFVVIDIDTGDFEIDKDELTDMIVFSLANRMCKCG